MAVEKPKLFGSLLSQVVRKNLCTFCGACLASCPLNLLWPAEEEPTMIGACAVCEICYYQCPQVAFSQADAERYLHGRVRRSDEPVGVVGRVYAGRALRAELQKNVQDGGAVTALMAYALDSKMIDAAVVAGRDGDWRAHPVVVVNSTELSAYAGTKYTPSPTLLGVRSALYEYGKSRVGMVGTPCQVRAVRRIQASPRGNRKLAEAVCLVVGLFCMHGYSHRALVGGFFASRGVSPARVGRVGIKRGSLIAAAPDGSELLRVPLREVDAFVRSSCRRCDDFTSEYADLSVGGVGCPPGYSTIVARTERGLRLVEEAAKAGYLEAKELALEGKGFRKVISIAQAKRSAAQANPASASGARQTPSPIQQASAPSSAARRE